MIDPKRLIKIDGRIYLVLSCDNSEAFLQDLQNHSYKVVAAEPVRRILDHYAKAEVTTG
jgi:hypothetical protein